MRNLLPPPYKKGLRQEYLLRLASIGGLLITVSMIVGVVFLIPAYLEVKGKETVFRAQFETLKESVERKEQETSVALLSDTAAKLDQLRDNERPVPSTEVISALAELQNDAIHIELIEYTARDSEAVRLEIRGKADTRSDLISFSQRVRGSDLFDSVNLPISNLAEDRNIEFLLNFFVKPREL